MYQSFIGLEIHIQLLTRTKVFCGCRAAFGDEPNTNVCPVCLGYPGVLPTLNGEAMRMAYVVARTLNCTLAERTQFERKNYYYPTCRKTIRSASMLSPSAVTAIWISSSAASASACASMRSTSRKTPAR